MRQLAYGFYFAVNAQLEILDAQVSDGAALQVNDRGRKRDQA